MITTILDGFKQLAPEGCEVVYSRGTNIIDLVDDPEGEFIRTASLVQAAGCR